MNTKNKNIWLWLKHNWPNGGIFYIYSDGHFHVKYPHENRAVNKDLVAIFRIKPKTTNNL